MSNDEIKVLIQQQLDEYKKKMLEKSKEEIYEDYWRISVREELANYIIDTENEYDWDILQEYHPMLLSYLSNQYLKSEYGFKYDEINDFLCDVINDVKYYMSDAMKEDFDHKIYEETINFRFSMYGLRPEDVYEYADRIVLYRRLSDYIHDCRFSFDTYKFLQKNEHVLSSIYDFVNSENYVFDKNDIDKIFAEYMRYARTEKEQTKEVEME